MSIEEADRFWRAVVDDLGLPLSRDWDGWSTTSRGIEWATWFLGARLNVAEPASTAGRESSPIARRRCGRQEGERRALTWAELSREYGARGSTAAARGRRG